MKKIFLAFFKKNFEKQYSKDKVDIIMYGLESIYLLLTKTIVILLIAFILNILKEVIIFTVFYNLLRLPSFGMHANKSYQCWILSIVFFICIPYLLTIFSLTLYIKLIINTISLSLIILFAPADTPKRPIIDKKRRLVYKLLSIIIACVMTILSFYFDNYIGNSLTISLLLQSLMILPITYKIFNISYNNYKRWA